MDELFEAIQAHIQQFGEFDVTIINLNMDSPDVKQKLMTAIQRAINTGVPITEDSVDLDLSIPEGAQS